jgi:AraC-like DNA-binding protein
MNNENDDEKGCRGRPSSSVRRFSDPDDYAAAIRGAVAEMTLTGRGRFSAKLTRIDLHRLWMQRFSESLPRIAHVTLPAGRTVVAFRTRPGQSLLRGGVENTPTTIILSAESDYYQRSSGPVHFGSMSLPTKEMPGAVGEIKRVPSRGAISISPRRDALSRLLRLHRKAGDLAEKDPEIIADSNAAQGLEQAVVHAMLHCLGQGRVGGDRSAVRRHQLIMRRFRQVLEAHGGDALFVPQVCEMIGVSERTLRRCCQEQIGMGPMRFLLLRRMQLARRALRLADPAAETVTSIATRFGFWELGRFAGSYRSLFAEPPSATLRRPPDGSRQPFVSLPSILAEIA